jgi:hypothetical protein
VTDGTASFVADPFLFYESGVWYMFFEAWCYNLQGVVALARSTDGIHWTYDRIVLDPPYHVSFPFVFQWEGEHYLTLESSDVASVRLFRAAAFPYQWEQVATLVQGRDYVDPAIFRRNGLWWMFVGSAGSLECRLFYSTQLTSGWMEHPLSPIVRNGAKARPAGRPFQFAGNRLIRLAQKSDVHYGEAVRAFEVDVLTPAAYAEHEIPESPILQASGGGWNSSGMHQCDAWWTGTHWLASVDGIDGWWAISVYRTAANPAGVQDAAAAAGALRLEPAFPNPFRATTEIGYELGAPVAAAPIRATVHDAVGRTVLVLDPGTQGHGRHRLVWDVRDGPGGGLPSGTYILRLQAGPVSRSQRVTLLR